VAADQSPLLDQAYQLPIAETQLVELRDSEDRILPTPQRRKLSPGLGAFLTLEVRNLPTLVVVGRPPATLGAFLT
jgi:hypothetical protein